ncbi:hypothetical protein SVIOM342S_10163 [Streptomyces violaceorubidus]
MVEGVADGRVHVAPLGLAEVVQAVGRGRRADVAAVGEGEHRDVAAVQRGDQVQGVFAGGGQAVHGDDPGRARSGQEPGRERTELPRDLDVGVLQVQGRARVPDVQVRGEPRPVAGLQGAVRDAFEAAYDGVGAVFGGAEDRAEDGVGAVTGEPVPAGAQCGQVPGEGDLSGGGAVHGEPGLGGQRPAGGRLERGVAGEPADGDARHPGRQGCGDGGCRCGDSAHGASLLVESSGGQWTRDGG